MSAMLDGRAPAGERSSLARHIASCHDCARAYRRLEEMRAWLRDVPVAAPPPGLGTRLRVLASHERQRLLERRTWRESAHYWVDRARFALDEMMRPLALPFAGGLLSALVLFSMLVPNLNFLHNNRNDVPISLYTEVSLVEMAPFAVDGDFIVDLTVDERGQITDFSTPGGKMTPELERQIGSMLLYTSFSPATWFGQPTSGKFRMTFTRNRIVVRG